MKKQILVTGGTGFMGTALVKRLLHEGYRVRILDDDSRGSRRRLQDVKDKIEFIHADIRNSHAVHRATKNVHTVFHLAYINGTEFFYTKPDLVLDVGIRGMINILDACRKNKVSEFFLASSSEVNPNAEKIPTSEKIPLVIPDPLNPRFSYAGGKIASELLAIHLGRTYLKRIVIFRPHNVYGPDMGWEHVIPELVMRIRRFPSRTKQPLKIQGTGRETRSFIYIDDFIDALMLLYQHGRHLGIYNIGNPHETKIADLVKMIAELLNKKIMIIPGKRREGSPIRRSPSITKLRKLGYRQRVQLRKGLKITVTWYDQHADERA